MILAVRETVLGSPQASSGKGFWSRNTIRYVVYSSILTNLTFLTMLLPPNSLLTASVTIVFAAAYFLLILRTSITFSALALDRSDIGFFRSFRATSGSTMRMAATFLATAALAALPWLAYLSLAGIVWSESQPSAETLIWLAVASALFSRTVATITVIAGAHIYRWIETDAQL